MKGRIHLELLLTLSLSLMGVLGEPTQEEAFMSAMVSAALAGGGSVGFDGARSGESKATVGEEASIAQKLLLAMASVDAAGSLTSKDSLRRSATATRLGKSVLTPAVKQQLLDLHNRMRSSIALDQANNLPPAANMALMEWDDRLASTAADWASQCTAGQTDVPANRAVPGLSGQVGQSTAADWFADPATLVAVWWDQRRLWDPRTGRCLRGRHGDSCAGIRQLASGSARLLGCDLRDCSSGGSSNRQFAVLLVCNYGGGDAGSDGIGGYLVGPACTACRGESRCLHGLCVAKDACAAAAAASGNAEDRCKPVGCTDAPSCKQLSTAEKTAHCANPSGRELCPKLCGSCTLAAHQLVAAAYQPENADKIQPRILAAASKPQYAVNNVGL